MLQNLGNPLFLSLIYFLSMYISLALYCVVPEGFHTSMKPEEALIYLYDGCMVRMSYLGSVQAMGISVCCLLTATCEDNPAIRPS